MGEANEDTYNFHGMINNELRFKLLQDKINEILLMIIETNL